MTAALADLPTLAGPGCVLRALRPASAPAMALPANDAAVARKLHNGFAHVCTHTT